MHTLPSIISCVPILTTVHPIAFAELRQSVWFSFLSQGLSTLLVLIVLSSIVPGTATLISLLPMKKKMNNLCSISAKAIVLKTIKINNSSAYQRRTPSFATSKISLEEVSIGRYFFRNSSSAR